MAYTATENLDITSAQQDSGTLVLQVDGPRLELPDATFVKDAELARDGQDLVIEGPHGTVIVESYFAQTHPPLLSAPDGTALTPDLVSSFIKNAAQYADVTPASVSDVSPVGAVQEISGEATVTRANGKVEILGVGSPIYQGDIIETSEDGAVNIVFVDESTFAVANDARMAIDEYVFDPKTNGGVSNFSVLKGVFVFTSGLIGRDDPDDVEISTPSGSIGIRGTIIAGNVDTGEITVIEGAIVLTNHQGQTLTLSAEFETAIFNAREGTIELVGQLSAHDVNDRYESVADVATQLFSTIREEAGDKGETEGDKESSLDDQMLSDDILQTADDGADGDLTTQLVSNAFEDRPLAEVIKNILTSNSGNEAPTTPAIAVLVEKFAFAENDASGAPVARLTAQFVDFANINLFGPSNNFFDIVRESDTSFLVSLKPGVSMDYEDPFNLLYVAYDLNGHIIADFSRPDVTNVIEPVTLTGAEPNNIGTSNFFSGSNGNTWIYDFSNEFHDPEGEISYYTVTASPSGPGIGSFNFGTDGVMTIGLDGTVDGSNYNITVNAVNAGDVTVNSVTITFDTVQQDNITGIMATGGETFSSSGVTADTVIISSDNNYAFTDFGNDTININGNSNKIMAGNGNDTINLTSGLNNFIHGGAGGDNFNLDVTANTKVYGGEDSDVFHLNTAAAVSGLNPSTIIDGGNDNLSGSNPGDVLRLDAAAGNIDFTGINDTIIRNIETVKTDNGVANTITLNYTDVIAMTDENNRLFINTDGNDTVTFVNGSGNTFYNYGTYDNNGETYQVYTDGAITVLVDTQAATVTGF